ncbi:sugar/nucleoside kinase (ribokinase family) [Dysgonomonadaceae bacterium PH5-43]|nr:sugar/nucleoside kinase (ribokinase family) [Dysgonomonadaceae bacterium PH5-43]
MLKLQIKMKILGIGNALVDVLVKIDNDNLLSELNLQKGSMSLIDVETRDDIFNRLANINYKITTGGSAGNTCLALSYMNANVGFVGKVGDNEYGKFYIEEFMRAGVNPHFIHVNNNHTGTAMTFISADGERTFGTYLGVAGDMHKTDLNKDVLSEYTYLYVEGYLVQNHELIEGALSIAKSLGLKIAIDLASYNIVEAEKEFLLKLINNYVDIVFANEEEAKALTGKEPQEAVEEIGSMVEMSIVKTGAKGSFVMCKGEVVYVPVRSNVAPLDTTAAGDYYAAGFLYGLTQNKTIKQCAELGTLFAGEIIQVIGTKLSAERWNSIKETAQTI